MLGRVHCLVPAGVDRKSNQRASRLFNAGKARLTKRYLRLLHELNSILSTFISLRMF